MSNPGGRSIQSRTVRHSPDKLQLKSQSKALVRAVGGQEAAAAFSTRIKRQQSFSDYVLPNTPEFMPLDVIDELEEVARGTAGWPQVTRTLCARRGGAFVELPEAAPECVEFHEAMGAVAVQAGGLTHGLCQALKDRVVTAGEVRDFGLLDQADELVTVAVNLRAMLQRVMEGER